MGDSTLLVLFRFSTTTIGISRAVLGLVNYTSQVDDSRSITSLSAFPLVMGRPVDYPLRNIENVHRAVKPVDFKPTVLRC